MGQALLQAWPSYVAYAVSFVLIGIGWANYHGAFSQIETVDRTFLMINVVFLMIVAFVPFPTKLVAANLHHPGLEAAALTYGFTLTLLGLAYALGFYASRGKRLLRPDADPKTVTGISRSFLPGPAIYLAATLLAFRWPRVSIVLFAVIAIFYMLESALFGRRVLEASD